MNDSHHSTFLKFVWHLKHSSSYREYFYIENNDLKGTKITSPEAKMKVNP